MHATRGLPLKEGSESLWRRGGDPISSDSPSALNVSTDSSHGHELFSARTIPFAARTLAGNHHVNSTVSVSRAPAAAARTSPMTTTFVAENFFRLCKLPR